MQSLINLHTPADYDWRPQARVLRSPSSYFSRRQRDIAAVAGHSPESSWLSWFASRADTLSRLGFIGALVLYALTAAYGISLSGQWHATRRSALTAMNELALAAGLGIANVTVDGQVNVTDADLTAALGAREGVSIFAFDTAAARERLREFGWVREARVMRLLPATLVVELEERAPLAVWREGGESVAIDASGRVLAPAPPSAFPSLPVVSGPGAASPAKDMLEALSGFPDLARRVKDIERIAGRRWDLLLDTGLRAKLPAGPVNAALADLNEMVIKNPAALYELAELDFRVASQFTLRLKDASEGGRKKFLSWFAKARGTRDSTL